MIHHSAAAADWAMINQQGFNTWQIAVGDRNVFAWNKRTRELAGFTRERLPDGVYRLARSGAIETRGGRIVGIRAPACSSAWSVGRGLGGVVLTRGSRAPEISRDGGRESIAVLDLSEGELLLVIGDGVTRMVAASPRAARGNPRYELAEDFAP